MKSALMRALALPECTNKHNKIQALTGDAKKTKNVIFCYCQKIAQYRSMEVKLPALMNLENCDQRVRPTNR